MMTSTFDPCLLYTKPGDSFGITAMQTDDTLSFVSQVLSDREQLELERAAFSAKPKTLLAVNEPIEFNGGKISLTDDGKIMFQQKGQALRLTQIDPSSHTAAQDFISQRARGGYIASICQPKASFDLALAAQAVAQPQPDDFKALNSRVSW